MTTEQTNPSGAARSTSVTTRVVEAGTKFSDRDGRRQVVATAGATVVHDEKDGRKWLSMPLLDADDRRKGVFKLQAPTGISSIDTASTQFMTLFQQGFAQTMPGVADEIAMRETVDGKFLGMPVALSQPRARQWTGAKQYKNGRTLYYSAEIVKYEISTEINRIDVEYDRSGVVSSWLDRFMQGAVFADDDLLLSAFNTNAWLSFDAVALLSASHTYALNGNNLSSSAFSAAVFKSAVATMQSILDEYGTPWQVGPMDLVVLYGPAIRRVVLEVLTGETRGQSVDSSGAYDTTSSVQGVSRQENVYKDIAKPLYTPWLTTNAIGSGNQWAVINRSAGVKPMVIAEARPWTPIMQIAMDGEARFTTDQYRFSLEKDGAYAAGFWPSIVGSVT